MHGTTEPEHDTWYQRFYASMSRRHSNALFNSIVAARLLRPPVTVATVLAYALAACVHILTLCTAIGSALLISVDWPNFYCILLGCCGLGFVWLARPRIHPVPVLLRRDEFPAIYELADRVADALCAKRVDGISVNGDYNAGYARAGWKQQRILYLGLPLWEALDDAERIDLIAHELAHNINHDYRSKFFVGTAVSTLRELHSVLYPDRILPTEIGLWAFAAVPFTLTSLGLSYLIRLCALGMEHLLWSSSQRAEYYADILAATVSGKKAAIGGIEKLLLTNVFHFEVQRIVMQRTMQADVFEKFRESAAAIPDREKERLLRVGSKMLNRMDLSHPPALLRAKMIEQMAPEQPSLIVPDSLLNAARREMGELKPEIQAAIIDEYRASIYD